MGVSEFKIEIDAEGGRIVFALSDEEASVRVTASRRGLCATWDVPFKPGDAEAFSNFFADLGQHSAGWKDLKSETSWRGDELAIECCFISSRAQPEVECCFILASDFQDPWWKVELNFTLQPLSLPELAARAAEFFEVLKRHLDAEPV
jgi:hypothetical protein